MSSSGDLGDAFAVDVAGDDARTERDARDDRGLGRSVDPLDVGGGVAFGVAELLRLRDGFGEARSLFAHARQHVVRRAVDDAHHPCDPLTGERLAQRPHERDTTRDRRLEQEVDPRGLGRVEQLLTEVREQLLVRGDDRLARLQRGEDEPARRLDPTDHLDHDVDAGIAHDRVGVVREEAGREVEIALLGDVVHRDLADLELDPGTLRDEVGIRVEQAHERGADVPTTQ